MLHSINLEQNLTQIEKYHWTLLQLDHDLCLSLYHSAQNRFKQNQFKQAKLSSSDDLKTEIRNDLIFWLDENSLNISQNEKTFLQFLEKLKTSLKEHFRVSLKNFECHYALYEKGHFYKRHRDSTEINNHRFFTFVLYLNPDWKPNDQGHLVGYQDNKTLFELEPKIGTMILFESHLEHEVKTTFSERFSLTGWFRTD